MLVVVAWCLSGAVVIAAWFVLFVCGCSWLLVDRWLLFVGCSLVFVLWCLLFVV